MSIFYQAVFVLQDDNTEVEENVEETHTTNGISKEIRKRPVIVERLVSAWGAWLAYMRHPVRDAGLGLSLLFMTVLAFDNYSRGEFFIHIMFINVGKKLILN